MQDTVKRDLCAREPIHVPGSIQTHGLLMVLDAGSGQVLQMAGDPRTLLGGKTGDALEEQLQGEVAALLRNHSRDFSGSPAYLGEVRVGTEGKPLTVTGHRVEGHLVIEIEPSGPVSPVAVVLSFVREAVERMTQREGLEDASHSIAADVRAISGFDRVMVYQFLKDGSGCVIAEQKLEDLPSFLHHRYPASDIPRQARELYIRNPIRVIPDVTYQPAPLVPAIRPGADEILDMSHCSLRSVSPVHIRYLKNMGVGASMSVSILRKGELWGLIACHHGSPKLVPFETREICQHLGLALSHYIGAKDDAEETSHGLDLGRARDQIFSEIATTSDPRAFLRERIADIQNLIPAHGVVTSIDAETNLTGHVPPADALAPLIQWVIATSQPSGVFVTDCLSEHYAAAGDFTAEASGLVAVVLPGEAPLVVLWFRAEQVEEVFWAGNPHAAVDLDGIDGRPGPRKSFDLWTETVRARCRPWSHVEVEAAHLLRARATLVLQEFQIRHMNAQIQASNARLSAMARTDELTGLANRRSLGERLQQEWARAARYARSLAAVAVDVDHFKKFNDRFGHPAGDDCLRQVAGVLGASGRPTDFAARTGGEEFVILLPETDLAGARVIAEEVRASVEGLCIDHPDSVGGTVTVSIGIAAADPDSIMMPEDLLEEADRALYTAKHEGRNRVAAATSRGMS
ncbi:sensor domain-containing diguanylate cyclase [Cereibacter changlensis]|nr:sensor domain-containing diguanylate cyclase [Cereibacter changlensis]PZX48564.1 diguanylate cyclase (GGDEF)-like protein [Cereibacter changlensis]